MIKIRQKKGEITLVILLIFEVVVPILVGFIFFNMIAESKNGEIRQKDYLSKDMSMIVESMYIVEGDMSFVYSPTTLNKYTFVFEKNNVTVRKDAVQSQGKTLDAASRKSTISVPAGFFIEKTLENPEQITIRKSGGKLYIESYKCSQVRSGICSGGKKIDENFGSSSFLFDPPELYSNLYCSSILLDAGHGSSPSNIDTGYVNGETKEEDITARIVNNLLFLQSGFKVTRETGQGKQHYIPIEQRKSIIDSSSVSAVISIHVGKYDPESNPITVYISPSSGYVAESKKLAGLIISELDQYEDFDTKAIKIVDPSYFVEYPYLSLLNTKKPAVIVEIGNIDYKKKDAIIKNTANIGNSINNAIKNYCKGQ